MAEETADPAHDWRPRGARALAALGARLRGPGEPGRPQSYRLVRALIVRLLGLVYVAAFVGVVLQGPALLGADGLTPIDLYLAEVAEALGADAWRELPSLFWLDASDAALVGVGYAGVTLGAALLLGVENAALLVALWVLQLSLVHVGQRWYGFGWETQLLETTLLVALLCPWRDLRPRLIGVGEREPPVAAIWLLRWLAFRIMLGAGLIKLRGDPCWADLTCLDVHFETQPNPHPGSWLFHQAPAWIHRGGVLFNHLAEVALPFFVFGPRLLRNLAGLALVAFQAALILSGNLSFLNWLTIVPCLACFDDDFLLRLLPRRWRGRLVARGVGEAAGDGRRPAKAARLLAWLFAAVVAWRSVDVVGNLLSPQQAMNRSFDRLHLVNTYGAFGSITRERLELVIEGTAAERPDGDAVWRAYELPCKPGDPARRPCLITPYHLRLDWLMWFAALEAQGRGVFVRNDWLLHLVYKLLAGDRAVDPLLAVDPFVGAGEPPPRFIRVEVYRYWFAGPGEASWWERERVGALVRPVALDDPQLGEFVEARGWLRD
ncbi:MAG: lipase maturation factor family protein [Nannocystaceae bacterium]